MRTRVIREMAICGFVFVAATVLRGQLLYPDPGTRPSFEVATVKQGHGAGQLYDLRLQPDRFLAENAPLDRLIRLQSKLLARRTGWRPNFTTSMEYRMYREDRTSSRWATYCKRC